MAAHAHPARDTLVKALRHIFRDRLRSVVAYALDTGDGLTSMAVVRTLTTADLEACAAHAHGWRRDGIATPLLMPEEEFRRSFDAFPLEYAEMLRAHEVLWGENPFEGATIDRADLRRACETQIKSHLVHLREGFIEAGGTPRAVSDLVTASAPAFGSLLRNIARLNGSTEKDRTAATRDGARAAQLPDGVVTDILALERPAAMKATDAARLFPAYLEAVEQLARYVDTWHL